MKIRTLALSIVLTLGYTTINAQTKMSAKDSVAYAIGIDMAQSLLRADTTMNPAALSRGLSDGYQRINSIDPKSAQRIIQRYFESLEMLKIAAEREATKGLEIQAAQIMDSLAKLEGVSHTKSGLLYRIEKLGDQKLAQEGDMVTVHYTLMTLDGRVIDSSYDRGEPLNFHNIKGQMIEGFLEGVQLLGEGGKIRLYVPPQLGYGDRSMGPMIKPYQVLVFDINLLGITPQK